MFGRRYHIATIFGIPVLLDWSWFLFAILVTWALATNFFPSAAPGLAVAVYWAMGAAVAIGLFFSVLLHEIGHMLEARRRGTPIGGITLFLFGGVAEIGGMPPGPAAEFTVAIAGPIVSVVLCGVFLALGVGAEAVNIPPAITEVLMYLGWVNGLLVIFNMIPAFPLDGGRVLRAAIWGLSNDLRMATSVTATLGSVFGALLIGLGIATMLFGVGAFLGGIWWILIGLFLFGAARAAKLSLPPRGADPRAHDWPAGQ